MLTPYFHYSAYWGTWSRVLHAPGKMHGNFTFTDAYYKGCFIEVNLTPVNGWPKEFDGYEYRGYQLRQVRDIRVRCHVTARNQKDQIWAELPEDIRGAMIDNLGYTLTQRLLTEDFLPQIDFDLYRKHDNGGANFEDIRR